MNSAKGRGTGNRWDLVDDVPGRQSSVAAIIPYYNQQSELDLVLAAINAQDYPHDLLQIVVADDGSTHAPSVSGSEIPTTVVRQQDQGFRAAAARNLGVAHCEAEVLCFLDADTVPQPDYIRRITALPSVCPEALVVGRRRHADFTGWTPQRLRQWWAGGEPPRELEEPRWLIDAYSRSRDLLDLDDHSYRYVISSVMCCTAALFNDLGGFDESFQAYGGEDWEFAHRAISAGAVLQHVRAAVAWHHGPDWAGRDLAERTEVKNIETLALARLVPDPDLRVAGLVYDVPAVAVQIDTAGHGPGSLMASIGSFLDQDVGIWVHGTGADGLLAALRLDDPRVRRGPIPRPVLRRCRHIVSVAGRAALTRGMVTEMLSKCGHDSVGAVSVHTEQVLLTCAASWALNRALRRQPTSIDELTAAQIARMTRALVVSADSVGLTQVPPHHPC